jgi:hypothetical protein
MACEPSVLMVDAIQEKTIGTVPRSQLSGFFTPLHLKSKRLGVPRVIVKQFEV